MKSYVIHIGQICVRLKGKGKNFTKLSHAPYTSGHMGSKKTLARITEWYMWKGVGKDVKKFVSLNACKYNILSLHWTQVICVN